eukprot:TRINITY_DN11281_c0_g1_i4.p1 TRINITY_DN11281_c0_g1~~TRINITY_DN11281_c0_g1_i4.p1  ORF type:complete len:300 (+),score=42.97 TRINITY_DN11281_c0_g1_i4:63-902(+)
MASPWQNASAPDYDDGHQCTIIDGAFDFAVQGALAFGCVVMLLLKWKCVEKNKRNGWLFLADNSKQCGGFFVAHVGNVVMSQLLKSSASPCVWYAINIFLDCTVRVFLAYGVLYYLMQYFTKTGRTELVFGDYGDPKTKTRSQLFCTWLKQSFLWDFIVLFTRIIMGLFVWALESPLSSAGTSILGPLEDYTHKHGHVLELFVVMIFWPAFLLAFQIWIQDAYLQDDSRHAGVSTCGKFCPCFYPSVPEAVLDDSTDEERESLISSSRIEAAAALNSDV